MASLLAFVFHSHPGEASGQPQVKAVEEDAQQDQHPSQCRIDEDECEDPEDEQ